MFKIILSIDGMACSMCESHINDAIRRELNVKKVTSTHSKGETVIISENEIDEEKAKEVIAETGYTFVSIESEPYKKKGFLFFGK